MSSRLVQSILTRAAARYLCRKETRVAPWVHLSSMFPKWNEQISCAGAWDVEAVQWYGHYMRRRSHREVIETRYFGIGSAIDGASRSRLLGAHCSIH
jgi:hypothetical protein